MKKITGFVLLVVLTFSMSTFVFADSSVQEICEFAQAWDGLDAETLSFLDSFRDENGNRPTPIELFWEPMCMQEAIEMITSYELRMKNGECTRGYDSIHMQRMMETIERGYNFYTATATIFIHKTVNGYETSIVLGCLDYDGYETSAALACLDDCSDDIVAPNSTFSIRWVSLRASRYWDGVGWSLSNLSNATTSVTSFSRLLNANGNWIDTDGFHGTLHPRGVQGGGDTTRMDLFGRPWERSFIDISATSLNITDSGFFMVRY